MPELASSFLTPAPRRALAAAAALDVEIVVPVYNEAAGLERSIRRLHRFLSDGFPFAWRIVIADNASVDATPEIARRLAVTLPSVRHLRLEQKGRGRALRAAWSASTAKVVTYMDVDLSTDLRGLLPLVAPLISGHSDLAIGTRLAHGSRVVRGPKREFISRSYNRILRTLLRAKFWRDGTSEPSSWQVSATDSTAGLQGAGGIGISSYLSSSATTAVTLSVDDLVVTAP